MKKDARKYTLGEEIANSITHGIGGLLSIAGLVVLIIFAAIYGTAWHVVGFTIFGVSLVVLYTMSTLYHSIQHEKAKHIFQILDHSSIFVLIAGTYTAFTLTTLRGPLGWTIFGIIWGLAALGITLSALYIKKYKAVAALAYIGMGWIVIMAIKPLWDNLPRISFIFLLIGGLCYTVGAVFYMMKKVKFMHAVWHLFVLGGSIFHFFSAIYSLPKL